MDLNNWRPPQGEAPPPPSGDGDWRSQLQPDSRQRIVNKITETLIRHLPFSGEEGLQDLKQIAIQFEEQTYSAATSQSDYLRKLCLKMLTMESKSQSTLPNAMPSNSGGVSRNPQDPVASQNMQSQVQKQNQSVPLQMVPNQSQPRQQLSNPSTQNNIASGGMHTAVSLPNTLPTNNLPQNPMPNVGQNPNLQNISGISQSSMGNTMNQGITSNMPERPSKSSLDSTAHTSSANGGDWQEEVYQKIKNMKDLYYADLDEMHHKVFIKLQQHDSVPQQPKIDQIEKLRVFKQMLERLMQILQISKNNILPSHREKLSSFEKQIVSLLNSNRRRKPVSSIIPLQPPSMQQSNSQIPQAQSHDGGVNPQLLSMNFQGSIATMPQSSVPSLSVGRAGGGQQSQTQQQLMSQLQSQPTQLQQQQLGLQQQQANSIQHNMQQRMQNMNPLLQPQNLIDQQKLFQSQRVTPEGPSTSLDSTAQTSSANGGDWQEEVYQKIKNMKDLYYADLNEMHQKIFIKLQQHDSVPQQPKIDQIEKLRLFKQMLEKLMQILQIAKNNILPSHREKLSSFEKQIVSLLNSNRPRKPVSSIIPPQPPSMQQSNSQIPQAHSHDGGVNPQLQSMNFQGSIATMPQSSVPSLSAITSSQPNTQSPLQPCSLQPNSAQASAPSSMHQAAITSMQQNSVGASQQANITSLQSHAGPHNGVSLLQSNVNNLQSNSSMLQNQHMKQQHEHQLKQQLHSKQMQQFQKQQLLQQQQLHHQAKQQQIQAHQIPQLHPVNDVNEKMRQLRSGGFPPNLSSAQRYLNQVKPGGSFPVSSPQLHNAVSPQINQHSSPQIDQQNLPPSIPKGGTPLHSANSPFVAPSPSTPLAPSPMPGDNEKSAVSSLSNAANVGLQQTSGTLAAPQSLSIGTPGISPSPLFECAGQDGTHYNASAAVSGKSSLTEQPIERLLRAVKSVSSKALSAAVSDMSSVVSMVDRIAGSAPGNGSRATVGEDLVAMTKCRLQARNFLTQDGNSGTKRMRRYTSAMPLNVGPSVGSMNDSLKQPNGPDTPELESTATSAVKKARIEVNHALLEEIREINDRLIDTVVDISDEDMDPSMAALAAEGSEGTIVKCSYNAITISPSLRSQFMAAQMTPIQPLKLLIPANYPSCSPILLDKIPVGTSNEHGDLSVKAKSRFSISLRSLSQPMSLKDIVRTWDDCARAVIGEYAQQYGGGTFSSKYGTWENCLST